MNETAIKFFNGIDQSKIHRIDHEVQYDFFKTPTESEIECLQKEMTIVKDSTNRVRKKLFAENGSLKMRVLNLEERLEILERNICRGKLN